MWENVLVPRVRWWNTYGWRVTICKWLSNGMCIYKDLGKILTHIAFGWRVMIACMQLFELFCTLKFFKTQSMETDIRTEVPWLTCWFGCWLHRCVQFVKIQQIEYLWFCFYFSICTLYFNLQKCRTQAIQKMQVLTNIIDL